MLDAIRGLAALGVLLFHAGYLASGWTAVPVFFALSGYLITRQLIGGMKPGEFWQRRATRLLPLFYLYLATNLVSAIAQGHDTTGYGWHFLGLSDVMIATGAAFTHGHIGHLWSIAIELQAYAIWPLIMSSRYRQPILAALGLVCLAAWVAAGHSGSMIGTSAFFVVGGLTAISGWQPPRMQAPVALVELGRASYSIYIWQMMCVGACARLGVPWLSAPTAIAFGLLSHHFVEPGLAHLLARQPKRDQDRTQAVS